MKKMTVIKWLVQFFLASLFVLLACKYFIGGGSMGKIVTDILITVPLASTLGVILGDLSLYKDPRFSILAVIIAIVLGWGGVLLGLFLIDLIGVFAPVSNVGDLIRLVSCFGVVTIPSLIGYNTVFALNRKYRSGDKEKEFG